MTDTQNKNHAVELILCLLFGYMGVHKFYKGKTGMGILYLCTFGLFGVGWIYDIVVLCLAIGKRSDSLNKDSQNTASNSNTLTGNPVHTYKVAGITHYTENVIQLATANPQYTMTKKQIIAADLTGYTIWKYQFAPQKAELIPEPDNPYDPNAIKVIVDGLHIGYIKKGSCAHLLNVIRNELLLNIQCELGGGPNKTVFEDDDDETGETVLAMEKDEISFYCKLTIAEKVR